MTESVLISKENKHALRMYKNSTFAYRNGKEFRVPFPPRQTEGGVFVPLVFIAEELGADVTYDAASRTYHLSIPITRKPQCCKFMVKSASPEGAALFCQGTGFSKKI